MKAFITANVCSKRAVTRFIRYCLRLRVISREQLWKIIRVSSLKLTSLHLIINSPKRDAFSAIKRAVSYISENYGITLEGEETACKFAVHNKQCIEIRCPF